MGRSTFPPTPCTCAIQSGCSCHSRAHPCIGCEHGKWRIKSHHHPPPTPNAPALQTSWRASHPARHICRLYIHAAGISALACPISRRAISMIRIPLRLFPLGVLCLYAPLQIPSAHPSPLACSPPETRRHIQTDSKGSTEKAETRQERQGCRRTHAILWQRTASQGGSGGDPRMGRMGVVGRPEP